MIRHAFIRSQTSRDPFNCSAAMFKYLLTFQQVSESFLDSVYTFGDQDEPLDFCLAISACDNTSALPDHNLTHLPRRGRSGREIRISYLLRSIEHDGRDEDGHWPWQIRQTAVYHSFDLKNGRSFWLTLKGNDLLKKRVEASSNDLGFPEQALDSDQDADAAYLNTTLATHLLYFAWCDEYWRPFINDVEKSVRGILEHAREARIDDHLDDERLNLATFPKSIRHAHSSQLNINRLQRAGMGYSDPSSPAWSWCYLKSALAGLTTPRTCCQDIKDLEKAQGERTDSTRRHSLRVDTKEVLDGFRVKDVQTLQTFNDRIQKALLTIKLSIKTIQEIYIYYDDLRSKPAMSNSLKPGYEDCIDDFSSQVQLIVHRLHTRQTQLECLALQITQGNALVSLMLLNLSFSRRSAD